MTTSRAQSLVGLRAWLLLGSCMGCVPSTGKMLRLQTDTGFATTGEEVLVSGPRGLLLLSLDGARERSVAPQRTQFRLEEVSVDGRVELLYGEDGTRLLVSRDQRGTVQALRLPLPPGAGGAVLSPDATRVAATVRPAKDTVGVAVVDLAALSVTVIPSPSRALDIIAFTEAGELVWLKEANANRWLRIADGTQVDEGSLHERRTISAATPGCDSVLLWVDDERVHQGSSTRRADCVDRCDCSGKGNTHFCIEDCRSRRADERGHVACLVGRSSGEWGPGGSTETMFFSTSCRTVIFDYGGHTYVAVPEGSKVGHLATGLAIPVPRL